jgi:hypothetical protein
VKQVLKLNDFARFGYNAALKMHRRVEIQKYPTDNMKTILNTYKREERKYEREVFTKIRDIKDHGNKKCRCHKVNFHN